MDIIFSHNACPDGFVAAMIAKRRYPEAEVIFLDHGANHTENLKKAEKRDVLMLDFSLRTREANDELAASTRSFQIYDHHKSAQEVLKDAPYAVFDMKRSGAGLAWDYLFGKDAPTRLSTLEQKEYLKAANSRWSYFSDARPWYVDYVEDRDLWNWKLPNSREICAYLGTLPFEFSEWDRLDHLDTSTILRLGQGALAHINHYVREAIKQTRFGLLDGNYVGVLNVPYLNCSEVGNAIAATADAAGNATLPSTGGYSLTWFERGDGITQFSLRSVGDFDVSAIAKKYGGGGHMHAAGFQMEYSRARLLIDVILGRSSYALEPGTCVR